MKTLHRWMFAYRYSYFEIVGAAVSFGLFLDGAYITAVLAVLVTALVQIAMEER